MNNQWRSGADAMVRWADGTYDRSRTCDKCAQANCPITVHDDRYKEIGQTDLELSEAGMASDNLKGSYWDWMHKNQPLGSFTDFDGETVTPEFHNANPDYLPDNETRESGIGKQLHTWMQEAYGYLTNKQKEAWDLVMREQLSHVDAAKRLNITRYSLEDRLESAKAIVSNYLRSKQSNAVA